MRASESSSSSLSRSRQLRTLLEKPRMAHLLKTARPKLPPRRTKSKHYFSPYIRPGRPPSLSANPDNLPGLDRFDGVEALGHQGNEVFQQDRLSTKNDNRDLSSLQILLVFKSTIDRQNNVEF